MPPKVLIAKINRNVDNHSFAESKAKGARPALRRSVLVPRELFGFARRCNVSSVPPAPVPTLYLRAESRYGDKFLDPESCRFGGGSVDPSNLDISHNDAG